MLCTVLTLTSLNHYLSEKIDEININSNKEPEDTESPNKNLKEQCENLKEQCENLQKDINDSLKTMKNDFEQFKMKSKNHKGFGSITDNPQYG